MKKHFSVRSPFVIPDLIGNPVLCFFVANAKGMNESAVAL